MKITRGIAGVFSVTSQKQKHILHGLMLLNCGRKLECTEKTHPSMVKITKKMSPELN